MFCPEHVYPLYQEFKPDIRFYPENPVRPSQEVKPLTLEYIMQKFFSPPALPNACCCEFINVNSGFEDTWCIIGPYAVDNAQGVWNRWRHMDDQWGMWRLRVFSLHSNIRPVPLSPGFVDTGDLLHQLEIPCIDGDP